MTAGTLGHFGLPVMDDLLSKLGNDHRKVRFMEWLCTAPALRDPSTAEELAGELGVTSRTLRFWKSDSVFVKEWDALSRKTIGSPENTQRLLENLLSVGLDPQHKQMVASARLWAQMVGAITPQVAEQEDAPQPLKDLSIDDLKALAAQAAQAELHRRNVAAK